MLVTCIECNSKHIVADVVIQMEDGKESKAPLCGKHNALYTLHYVGKTNSAGQTFLRVEAR